MNTILTDDERRELVQEATSWQELAEMTEAAVLAKLREQEPLCTLVRGNGGAFRYSMPDSLLPVYALPAGEYPLYAAPLPAVVQVPQGWKLVPVEALTRWRDAFAEELAAYDIDPPIHHVLTSHDEIAAMLAAAPEAPAQGLHQQIEQARQNVAQWPQWMKDGTSVAELRLPEAPAQGEQHCRWCDACGEGVTTFCRGKTDACPMFKKAPAQAIPAPWREAVKVAREALGELLFTADDSPSYDASIKQARAALAQLDALEGGE